MGRNLEPKCQQCRREGKKLFLKGERCYTNKCSIERRNYPPGVHGPKGAGKLTDYGLQLREKQKAKRYYGILEKQFRLYYERAQRKRGNSAEALFQLLESRLDTILTRFGFCLSHRTARQFISHGHVKVNGKVVNIPSFIVRKGDVIELNAQMKKNKDFEKRLLALEKYEVPAWLALDLQVLKGRVLELPKTTDVELFFDIKRIIEFYSR